MDENRQAPVKEGETYDVLIEGVGGKGDGIARVKGFVLFVPRTKEGEYVKVRVAKVLRNVGFGEVIQTLERPSRQPKVVTARPEELEEAEENPAGRYEDTEDFGAELEEK